MCLGFANITRADDAKWWAWHCMSMAAGTAGMVLGRLLEPGGESCAARKQVKAFLHIAVYFYLGISPTERTVTS